MAQIISRTAIQKAEFTLAEESVKAYFGIDDTQYSTAQFELGTEFASQLDIKFIHQTPFWTWFVYQWNLNNRAIKAMISSQEMSQVASYTLDNYKSLQLNLLSSPHIYKSCMESLNDLPYDYQAK